MSMIGMIAAFDNNAEDCWTCAEKVELFSENNVIADGKKCLFYWAWWEKRNIKFSIVC